MNRHVEAGELVKELNAMGYGLVVELASLRILYRQALDLLPSESTPTTTEDERTEEV